MSEIIKAYYLEHKAVFDEKFSLVLQGFNADAIHKMRTSTKRLRSLFILISFLSDQKFKPKKQLQKIRLLFKHVGKIREIQIEQMLIWSYEEKLNASYPEYLEYLMQREYQEIGWFMKHLPLVKNREKLLKDPKVISRIESLDPDKLEIGARKYIDYQIKVLNKTIAKQPSNHRIHEVRTTTKQMYYLHDILTEIIRNEKVLNVTSTRLREIEQYLGTWHDLVNSAKYMNAWLKTRNAVKSDKYIKLKKQIQADTKVMRKEIVKVFYPELKSN
jgi:CHAD domain-containing protein